MTAHSDEPWKGRWFAPHESPSMDLCQRKPWDTLIPANHAAADEPIAAETALSLEIAVAGADAPWGHFSLPDESPVHLPPHYEPNYAYPLIVWLHDDEWNARELLDLMPRISPQSYLGLAVEGLTPNNRFANGPMSPIGIFDPLDGLLETLKDVVRQMRREFTSTASVFIWPGSAIKLLSRCECCSVAPSGSPERWPLVCETKSSNRRSPVTTNSGASESSSARACVIVASRFLTSRALVACYVPSVCKPCCEPMTPVSRQQRSYSPTSITG